MSSKNVRRIVLDNAPYHFVEIDKLPILVSRTGDIQEWFRRKNRLFEEGVKKKMN
jgi:hypothetical protein